MNSVRKTGVVAAALLFAAPLVWAQLVEDQGVEISSPRTEAIGGPHAALADDLTSLFNNPAAFSSAGPEVSLAQVTMRLTGPIFSIADVIAQIMGNGLNLQTLLTNQGLLGLLGNLYAVGTLDGPLAFGYVGDGLGFGFFNSTGISFSSVSAGLIPVVTASLGESVLFLGGYSFRVPLPESLRMTLDLGLEVKSFIRGQIDLQQSVDQLLGAVTSLSLATLLGLPLSLDAGAGLDVGIRYSWANFISFGVVARNLPTFTLINSYSSLNAFTAGGAPTATYGYVPIDLSSGIMLTPDIPILDRFITNMKFPSRL